MADVLVSFIVNCGRMGSLEGLFVCTRDELEAAHGRECYFGDVLGKHSEIHVELDDGCLEVKSEDQDFIAKLVEVVGHRSISGINPLGWLEEIEEEE